MMSKIEDALNQKLNLILEDLKSLVIMIRDQSPQLRLNAGVRKIFADKKAAVDKAVAALNDKEKDWLDREYQKWFNTEIMPAYQEKIEKLKGMHISPEEARRMFGI
jgi:hypothetical protein